MAPKIGQQDKWILATSVALSLLSILYVLLLFPKELTTAFVLYLNYLSVALIVLLALFLTAMLYRKQQKTQSKKLDSSVDKTKKIVKQLIWRNRYVLQSQKGKLNHESVNMNIEQWNEIKATFAKKYIFPVVSENEISLKVISELIDKSLTGAAIGGIRPPTYSVRSINR